MLQRIARQDLSWLAPVPPRSLVGVLCSLWLLPGSNCMLLSELSFSDCRRAPSSPSHFGFKAFPALFAFGCLCRMWHVLSPHVRCKCFVCQVVCLFLFVFCVLVFLSNFSEHCSSSPVELVELYHFGVSFIPTAFPLLLPVASSKPNVGCTWCCCHAAAELRLSLLRPRRWKGVIEQPLFRTLLCN